MGERGRGKGNREEGGKGDRGGGGRVDVSLLSEDGGGYGERCYLSSDQP